MIRAPLIKNQTRLLHARSEALRTGGYSPEMRSYLRTVGLDLSDCIAHAGFLSVALVTFSDDSFAFDIDGKPAALIEALLFDWSREQFVADIVAWPVSDPSAFTTAMGSNDGADVLGPAHMVQRCGGPLMIHRTPLAWLQAHGEGCCLLKPGARHWLRRVGGPFVVADVEHGREVRDLLGPDSMRHRILVRQHSEAA
mgnify:CR=1 FL=1